MKQICLQFGKLFATYHRQRDIFIKTKREVQQSVVNGQRDLVLARKYRQELLTFRAGAIAELIRLINVPIIQMVEGGIYVFEYEYMKSRKGDQVRPFGVGNVSLLTVNLSSYGPDEMIDKIRVEKERGAPLTKKNVIMTYGNPHSVHSFFWPRIMRRLMPVAKEEPKVNADYMFRGQRVTVAALSECSAARVLSVFYNNPRRTKRRIPDWEWWEMEKAE